MTNLPAPSPVFAIKKETVLRDLAVPDSDYTDASPKGTVDANIRELIDEINGVEGFVTTSSCSGRVSVFLEGKKKDAARGSVAAEVEVNDRSLAGVGGKGGGGSWLFVSHDPVSEDNERWCDELGLIQTGGSQTVRLDSRGKRLIHFKFEPMILHVLTSSLSHAQLLLKCALQAGFREAGAVNVAPAAPSANQPTPMVAVRSQGLSFESLIGYESMDGQRCCIIPEAQLAMLMQIANERFAENAKRIERFRQALRDNIENAGTARKNADGTLWESSEARSQRMREEGLRRKNEQAEQRKDEKSSPGEVLGLGFTEETDESI